MSDIFMLDFADLAYWSEIAAFIAQEKRDLRRLAFAPQMPPSGMQIGKTIFPRVRANLWAGMRNRFGKEDVTA